MTGVEGIDRGDRGSRSAVGAGKGSQVFASQSVDLGDPERSELNRELSFLDTPPLGHSDSPDSDGSSVGPAPGPAVSSFRQATGVCPGLEADKSGNLSEDT